MQSVKYIQRTYYLIIVLFWLAVSLPMALMIILAQERGANLFQIGLLMGLYSLTVVLLELPTGGLADAIGRKKVAMLAYGFMLGGGIVYLFAFSFPAFLLALVLNGIARALSSGALDAWFIDSLQAADPGIDIQPSLAKAGTVTLFALACGTLLGGVIPRLFTELPAEGTAVITPFSTTILFSIAVNVLLLVVTAVFVQEIRPADAKERWQDGFRQTPKIVREAIELSRHNRTLVLLLGTTVSAGLTLAALETFWQPHFSGLLGNNAGNSLYYSLILGGNFVLGMVGNMLSTPLSKLMKKRYGLVAALFQAIRGIVLILLAMQTAVLPAALLFWGVYLTMGIVNSPHETLVNREIPAGRRSTMLSVQSLAAYTGGILGSMILGLIAQQFSIGGAWIVTGSILMVSCMLYWQVDKRTRTVSYHEQENTILETS